MTATCAKPPSASTDAERRDRLLQLARKYDPAGLLHPLFPRRRSPGTNRLGRPTPAVRQWPPALGRHAPSRVIPPESTSTAFTVTVPQAQTAGWTLSSSYPPKATPS
jgi:hypothetical protein